MIRAAREIVKEDIPAEYVVSMIGYLINVAVLHRNVCLPCTNQAKP